MSTMSSKKRPSSSAHLSRSLSDGTDTRPRPPSRPLQASSSRDADTKASLPRQKVRALEQFVKFGRKGKGKEPPPQFPPASWFPDSASNALTPAGAASESTAQTTSGRDPSFTSESVSKEDAPVPRITGTINAQEAVQSSSSSFSQRTITPPTFSSSLNRPGIAETGVERVHAEGTTTPSRFLEETAGGQTPPLPERGFASAPVTPGGEHPPQNTPEPLTLAKRIQALIYSRPALPALLTPSATNASSSGSSETAGPSTPLASQPPPPPIADSAMISLLSNAGVMSGSLDKGRQSVFAILDRLRLPSRSPAAPSEGGARIEEESDDDSSVMLYGPLEPNEDSEVEIARSDIMSVYDDGETIEYERPAQRLSMLEGYVPYEPRSPLSMSTVLAEGHAEEPEQPVGENEDAEATGKEPPAGWFDSWKGKVVEGSKIFSDKVAVETKTWKDKMAEGSKVVKTKIRWVPSPDKISFQATWWGYRLYLPPPVLEILNNKRIEAAKRAAMITTALQWLLGRVPLTIVPLQFRPGLMIAQRLVPYLGYIGGFVAWSWGAMKSFDKGSGIVLTATWLLPVALIPGTWDPEEGLFSQDHGSNVLEGRSVQVPDPSSKASGSGNS
ncbi:hypothetical protein BV25DRAFT_1820485 [Artomyces pyxidatus]|uniref:Uncharacterized protein n=1 Tax=Artomyces pyxidatus TaxID=48021 RepID=A0ACB8TDL1_9AGAM|nr:hypothetical protein BV25DRAFT_1820485 [Artomyces pyxidatus]